MANTMTALEMFEELVRQGFVVPATVEPYYEAEPTAYVSAPDTNLVFASPPMPSPEPAKPATGRAADATLGKRTKRDTKRKRRSRR